MKIFILVPIGFLLLFGITACKKNNESSDTRSFYMGVTPWPADFTVNEVDSAYNFINNHCDIVSHHFDDGIPYEEAFANRPMPPSFQQEVQTRKMKTARRQKSISERVSAESYAEKKKRITIEMQE